MAASTTRAMKGIAAMVRGTTAARVPIEVPAIKRVSGTIATTRMMKGVERVAFTTRPRMRLAAGAGNSSFVRLVARKIPSGSPISVPNRPDNPTITKVSTVDHAMSWISSGDITKVLHDILARMQFGDDVADNAGIRWNRNEQRSEGMAGYGLDLPMQNVDVDRKRAR